VSARVAALVLCAGLCACDGVGRSLVDDRDEARLESGCEPPPTCSDRTNASEGTEVVVPPVDEPAREACPGTLETLCIADASAAVSGDCDRRLDLNDGELAQGPGPLTCTALRIFAGERARLELPGLALSGGRVTVESARPLLLALPDAALEHARIDVTGPVSVRVLRGSLDHVLVVGERASAGTPALELEESRAEGLTVLRNHAPFAGMLSITRSDLRDVWLSGEAVQLESNALEQGTLLAGQLNVVDGALGQVTLSFDSALISAAQLTRASVVRCDSLTLVGSRVEASDLFACRRGPLRVYDSAIRRSAVDGRVESDA
jgi:hypothetical protein